KRSGCADREPQAARSANAAGRGSARATRIVEAPSSVRLLYPPRDRVLESVTEGRLGYETDVFAQAAHVGDEILRIVGPALERAKLDEVGSSEQCAEGRDDLGHGGSDARSDVDRPRYIAVDKRCERASGVADMNEVAALRAGGTAHGLAEPQRLYDRRDERQPTIERTIWKEQASPREPHPNRGAIPAEDLEGRILRSA